MLEDLPTEQRNPASAAIDVASTREMLEIIHREDRRAVEAVGEALPAVAAALDAVHVRFVAGARIFYVGAGTSGRLGVLDAVELPPTYGLDPDRVVAVIAGGREAVFRSIEGAEDDPEAGGAALRRHNLLPADVVIGVAASGRTPFVLGAVRAAREAGCLTVGVATNPGSELGRAAEFAIEPDVGPEVVTGSTRMKSGTAQKLVLNMLSTGLMIKTGCVFGNLMVNVRLANSKLWDRAERVVAEIAGCGRADARASLRETSDVRVSALALRFNIPTAQAARLLDANGGVLARAMAEISR